MEFEVEEVGKLGFKKVLDAAKKRHAGEQKEEERRIAAEQMRIFGETF